MGITAVGILAWNKRYAYRPRINGAGDWSFEREDVVYCLLGTDDLTIDGISGSIVVQTLMVVSVNISKVKG